MSDIKQRDLLQGPTALLVILEALRKMGFIHKPNNSRKPQMIKKTVFKSNPTQED